MIDRPDDDARPAMAPDDFERVFGRGRLRMVTGRHVEVFREEARPGERRRYTKRFLATDAGDFRLWTEREWRILARLVGHGIGVVPEVLRFDRGGPGEPAFVQTYDAGITVDHWATLLPVQRDGQELRHVFEDCAHWWALARQVLAALDEIHELRVVHLDLKADNVCIPAAPADFDPRRPGSRLQPRFEQMALIDFAFSLVWGDALTTGLPLARQPDYDYQSPRLLAALDAARRGDLEPTRRLDWRCDLYSLAAMLARYLPDPHRSLDGDWDALRLARARSFVRRLHEIHDAELPAQRPHAELAALVAHTLDDRPLAASLRRGWQLAPRRPDVVSSAATPITRVALPLAPTAATVVDRRADRRGQLLWQVSVGAAAVAISVPLLGEAWWAFNRAPAERVAVADDAAAAPAAAAPEPAAVPAAVSAPEPAASAVGPASSASAPASPTAAAAVPAAAPAEAPVEASAKETGKAPGKPPEVAPLTAPAKAPVGPSAEAPPETAPRVAPASRSPVPPAAAPPTPTPTPTLTPPRQARAAPPIRRAAPKPPATAPAPAPAPKPRLAATTGAPGRPTRTVPWLEPRPATAVARAPTPQGALPPAPPSAAPPSAAPPSAAPESPPAVPRPAVAAGSPDRPALIPTRDLQQRAQALMAADLPRIAERAERLVLRVLFAAARAERPQDDDDVRHAAAALRLAPPEALAALAPQEARELYESALQAWRRGGELSLATDLMMRAFAANPLDPDIAGDLAALRLRPAPPQADAARQLALHALTTAHPRHPYGRLEDWTTLAVASALAGRERDAGNAWYVTLALAPSVDRLCRAAVNAQARYGERLRPSVEALLQRVHASGRAGRSVFCEWPPHWAAAR